jgi:uncharacterized protein YdhG (YjbR/CyaY superfamily)
MAATKTKAKANVWTDEERAAMQESARERKSQAKLTPEQERAAGEAEVQAKIAEMPDDDRAMAQRVHELVTTSVPAFVPRTYYGMPAYALDGKTICFFQPKSKFKVRYSTFGFQPEAKLDDGDIWPTAFAVTELTPKVEARIVELAKKAAG